MMTPNTLTTRDVQSFIDARGLGARLIRDIGHTPTVPAAAAALGVHPDQIVKTLLFLLDTGSAAGGESDPLVVISNGTNRVDKKALASRFGIGKKRVRLAPPEVVLSVLGYPAGGVPPFAHRNCVPNLSSG
jgi:prolyl-tRNA editing enzyme YbaK/EbsC (Cys-tRNA(Pro) deacylase)